ncbi:MAG: hypothetical protein ACRCXT_18475 [Paraclostridium sp.]
MSRKVFEDNAMSREDLLLDEFLNLAINRFTWTNLPKGLTSERLEEMLICHGTLGAFVENELLLILPLFGTNKVNIYNEHTDFNLFGYNGATFTKNVDDIVKLKNNQLGTEDLSTLQLYAKKIDDIEQTQDVNLFQQNIPKLIGTTKDGILTAKNIIKQIKEFKFVIFTKGKGIEQQLKKEDVLDNTAPFLLDKLGDYENFYRNKVLTFLGINNANTDKRERLITSEVDANNDYIQINLDLMYDMRKRFCDEVNAKFGINIKVEKRKVENEESNNSEDDRE